LLAFADEVSRAESFDEICTRTVETATTLFATERASLWLGDRCAARVGEPLADGTTAALAEGDGVHGRLVLQVGELDEHGERLLASFAYQTSVALQKAHLYWKQLEAAEIANALLDASRELATAESPEDVLGRVVEVTGRVLDSKSAALWIEEEPGAGRPRRARVLRVRAGRWLLRGQAVSRRPRPSVARA